MYKNFRNYNLLTFLMVLDIEVAEKFVSGGVGELGVDNVVVNTTAPQDGNVKFTIMPNGGGEGARRADACAPFGFASLRQPDDFVAGASRLCVEINSRF
jgi:hypothetical protein